MKISILNELKTTQIEVNPCDEYSCIVTLNGDLVGRIWEADSTAGYVVQRRASADGSTFEDVRMEGKVAITFVTPYSYKEDSDDD